MTDEPDLKPETLTAHGGRTPDTLRGDVAPPLRPSTNYARDENYQLIGGQGSYARDESPSYPEVEALLTRLEGGAGAMVFASGMAAATAVWLSLEPGDGGNAGDHLAGSAPPRRLRRAHVLPRRANVLGQRPPGAARTFHKEGTPRRLGVTVRFSFPPSPVTSGS